MSINGPAVRAVASLHERGFFVSRFATRLAATALVSGALLAAATLPAAAANHGRRAPQRSSVVLGAIQYDSPGPDNRSTRSLNAEWVTVTNTARSAINLNNWTLSDADHHTYRFNHVRLGGHQSVRVHTGTGRDTARNLYQDRRAYMWNNNTDTATLRNANGHLIDSKSWGHHR
jgi:hypothetical protein